MSKFFTKLCLVLPLSLLLSACTLPSWLPHGNEPGRSLAPGERVALHFFPRIANYDSGISLQSGAQYQINFTLMNNWSDSDIERNEDDEPLDERGFANSLMPYEWIGLTRRSREHRWFEVMLVQPNCKRDSLKGITNLSVDEAGGSYNFVATCDGKLTLFVNDSYGFYSNNIGYANIALSRVN